MAHHRAGTDRNGALHHEDGPPVEAVELVDDSPDGGEVGVARIGRRRADGDVQNRRRHGLADIERVRQPVDVAAQQLLQTRLPDRNLAGTKLFDAVGKNVAHHDLVAEFGQARPGDETDVAGSEDSDLGHARNLPT